MTSALLVQLTASALTIAGTYFYGNKSPWGPWFGIAAQVPWWLIMVSGGLWGLLPVNGMMLVLHVRNLIKWRREAQQRRADELRSSRETLQACPEHPATVQAHHGQRHSAKAYEILSGGELR